MDPDKSLSDDEGRSFSFIPLYLPLGRDRSLTFIFAVPTEEEINIKMLRVKSASVTKLAVIRNGRTDG